MKKTPSTAYIRCVRTINKKGVGSMLNITKMLIKYNYSNRGSNQIKYIVVHCTGNYSYSAGVDNHFSYFNGANRGASADYFVDDKKIGQFVEPWNYSWHCGDGGGKYGITNSNSVGVEICVNGGSHYPTAVKNASELVAYLMKKHGISILNVKRHYDASRKHCPNEIMNNKDGISWEDFKQMVQNGGSVTPGKLYRVRRTWEDAASQKGAFTDLNNAKACADQYGLNVYDETGKCVYSSNELYRVRRTWEDAASQKGAFTDLNNAKACADQYGLNVYNKAGVCVYRG